MLDDIREWLSDNLRYILLGLAAVFVIIIGILVFRLIKGPSDSKNKPTGAEQGGQTAVTAQTEAVKDNEGESEASAPAAGGTAAEAEVPSELTKDDAAVLTVMNQYFTGKIAHDAAAMAEIVDPWNSTVESKVFQNDMIEGFDNLSTYSTPGLEDGSFAVFSYYEAKMTGVDAGVPALIATYLKKNDAGKLTVYSYKDDDPDVSAFMQKVSNSDSVQTLARQVQTQYEQVRSANPELDTLLDSAAGNSGSSSTPGKETETEQAAERTMTAMYDLNIRETASTDANILGTVAQNSTVTVIGAQEGDGFVRISYDTGAGVVEGYVKLEYLAG